MRIARVFPRRTKASPDDGLAFFDAPGLFPPEVDEVHVSVAFTWDIIRAEMLVREWKGVAPVKIGGPAFGKPSGDFVAGRYLKQGNTITSRGCPNRCWFCAAWKREGGIRELSIVPGNTVHDDNLLACSDGHVRQVFAMLREQKKAGKSARLQAIEAKAMKPWHADIIATLRPKTIYMAYDTPDDREPLADAASSLFSRGISKAGHSLAAYVLVGYPKDTIPDAVKRLEFCISVGVMPMAMLYRDDSGKRKPEWISFQKQWADHIIVGKKMGLHAKMQEGK